MSTRSITAPPPGPDGKLFVGLDEAAKLVNLSRRTLERWIASGELPVRRIGRRVLVKPSDLADRIEGHLPAAVSADGSGVRTPSGS